MTQKFFKDTEIKSTILNPRQRSCATPACSDKSADAVACAFSIGSAVMDQEDEVRVSVCVVGNAGVILAKLESFLPQLP